MLKPCSKLLSSELGKSAFKNELRCFCLKKSCPSARNIDRAQTGMGAPTPKGLHQSAYLPQFKSRFFYSLYRFQKLLEKMPFNIIPPQVLPKSWCISFDCMISKQNTMEVMVVLGMLLLSRRLKIMGNSWDRQHVFDWHVLSGFQEFTG